MNWPPANQNRFKANKILRFFFFFCCQRATMNRFILFKRHNTTHFSKYSILLKQHNNNNNGLKEVIYLFAHNNSFFFAISQLSSVLLRTKNIYCRSHSAVWFLYFHFCPPIFVLLQIVKSNSIFLWSFSISNQL